MKYLMCPEILKLSKNTRYNGLFVLFLQVRKGSDQKQPRKRGDTIFPIISLEGFFSDAQEQPTPLSVVGSGQL